MDERASRDGSTNTSLVEDEQNSPNSGFAVNKSAEILSERRSSNTFVLVSNFVETTYTI